MSNAHSTDDLCDTVSKAMRKAWQLGQTYWQQADSESLSQHKKADITQQKFDTLMEETRLFISTPSPAWCASVDAELADTAEADAGPLGWYAATETAAEEYDLDGEFVRSLFVELLPAWLLAPEETHLLIEIDSLISEDDYGIYGSDFYQCRLCHGESGAGVLNKGIVHEDSCPLADSNYAKAVEKTRQAFASITLPAAAVAEGLERNGGALEQAK